MDALHDRTPFKASSSSEVTAFNGNVGTIEGIRPKYFRSHRVRKEDIQKPWLLEPPDPKEKWIAIIPFIGAALGMAIAGVLVWDGWRRVTNHTYCLVYEDDFSQGLDPDIWESEIQAGGFGFVPYPALVPLFFHFPCDYLAS